MDDAEIQTLEFLLSQTINQSQVAEIMGMTRLSSMLAILRSGVHEIKTPSGLLYPRSEVEALARTYVRTTRGRKSKA